MKGEVLNRLQAAHPHPLSSGELSGMMNAPMPDVVRALHELKAEYEVLETRHGLWLWVPPLPEDSRYGTTL